MNISLEKSNAFETFMGDAFKSAPDLAKMHAWLMENLEQRDCVVALRLHQKQIHGPLLQVGFDICRYKSFVQGYVVTAERLYEIKPGIITAYHRPPQTFTDLRPYPHGQLSATEVFYPKVSACSEIYVQLIDGSWWQDPHRFSAHTSTFPLPPNTNGMLIRNSISRVSPWIDATGCRKSRELWVELVDRATDDKSMRNKLMFLRDGPGSWDKPNQGLIDVWHASYAAKDHTPEETRRKVEDGMARCLNEIKREAVERVHAAKNLK